MAASTTGCYYGKNIIGGMYMTAEALHKMNAPEQTREHREGTVARSIENQTAKLPSDLFLWAAIGSIGVSFFLEVSGNYEKSRFVGQWVAPFLLLGIYNKIVKVAGSDSSN
jgi:hypothetical protein